MVKCSSAHIDAVFHALSDSTRRALLARLALGDASVGELASPFDMSLAAISKHLKVLEGAELVEKTRDGRTFRCHAHFESLEVVHAVLDELAAQWRDRLAALDQYFTGKSVSRGETYGKQKKRK